jgi:hypothetical protein
LVCRGRIKGVDDDLVNRSINSCGEALLALICGPLAATQGSP